MPATTEFDRQFAQSARPTLMDGMSETVVYWKRGSLTGRSIQAIVHRRAPSKMREIGEMSTDTIVKVIDDATDGISSSELDTGGDAIELAVRLGETASRRQIMSEPKARGGMLQLELA